ncbi:MAG: hypothetical protein AAGJ78_06630 [Pseudomonadota bacterium]|nr:hypothetical protein [Vibrio sinaloensis]UPQ89760.1 hypothetical protein MTO69_18610 [Vibrio sinaloensis]
MTINKYFVFVPSAQNNKLTKEEQQLLEKEAQRQALVKQAQQQGGL